MEEYYYIDDKYITYCYPHGTSKKITTYGVLGQYVGKKYTREEMDKIIAEMVIRHPYIEGSMNVHLNVMKVEIYKGCKYCSFYHMLNFYNYNFRKQVVENTAIKWEK